MGRSNGDKPPVAYVARGVWPDADMTPDAPPSASAAQHVARALGAAMALLWRHWPLPHVLALSALAGGLAALV